MRILHLAQFLGVGGLEKVLFLLIQEQMKNGHDVELVVYDHEQTWVPTFRQNGIKVTTDYLKKPGYDRQLIAYFNAKAKAYDVVHTHDLNPAMYVGPGKWLRKIKFKKFPKFVHTTHGMEHIDAEPRTRVYEKLIAMMADNVVGVSPNICRYYTESLRTRKSKVHNIDNGTPVPAVIPARMCSEARQQVCAQFSLNPNQKIWVAVARIVPLKDQKLLAQVIARLPEQQLLLVGPSGNQAYWNELKHILPTNARMVGGQENISEILAGCDYFISASHHEGIPISVLEAGAAGRPCVLSDIPGHKTLQQFSSVPVANYFDMANLESLYEKMKLVSSDEQFAEELRQNMFRLVQREYSITKMYNQYMDLYQD